MNSFIHNILHILKVVILVGILSLSVPAKAFSPETYAASSVLDSGKWVRITVKNSGLYILPKATLRSYGFNDLSKVRVYGYGGKRISDLLSESEYIDDLPPVQVHVTDNGIIFYANGLENEESTNGFIQHRLNPFANEASYFITYSDTIPSPTIPSGGIPEVKEDAATIFQALAYHELDAVSPGESGHILVGEDLKYSGTRTFDIATPGIVDNSEVVMQVKAITAAPAQSQLLILANGTQLSPETISSSSAKHYGKATTATRRYFSSNAIQRIGISITPGSAITKGWLDYIDINYTRKIELNAGTLCFTASSAVKLAKADSSTIVWDVTYPNEIVRMNTISFPDGVAWTTPYAGKRRYAAFNTGASLPVPTFLEVVRNQNLHAVAVPDMVIISPREWNSQAQRIADLHKADSLKVLIVNEQEIFNEFSSGTPDIAAYRKFFKMLYDRSTAEQSFKYALLLGRATHDQRSLTASYKSLNNRHLLAWQTDDGLVESTSYICDDFLGFLEDDSGLRPSAHNLCIAVGRVPAGTLAEATAYVDKLENYMRPSTRSGAWKNKVLVVADDGDSGAHLRQAESFCTNALKGNGGDQRNITKVYVDAFDEVGGESVVGRDRMHRALQDGVVWWSYIGHANKQGMTSEKLLVFTDMSTIVSRHPTFLYGATCSFMRWDGIEKSGGELLLLNPNGGIIGSICATREVYISENGYFTDAVGRFAFSRDSCGRHRTVGDIYRLAKNDLRDSKGNLMPESSNKLRFTLVGDPALRLSTPDINASALAINSQAIDNNEPPTIMARQNVTIEGCINQPGSDEADSSFSGTVDITLYDAEYSITSQGRPSDDTEGKPINFENQGNILYAGCDSVSDGRFAVTFNMPAEISDNFRPGAISLYARSDDGREAMGINRNIYIFGYDDAAVTDTVPPVIETIYLNHSSFSNGSKVNVSPMFIAKISDNVGINLSTAGVGHRMIAKLDDNTTFNDLSTFYTPSSNGTPSGTIQYPLENLALGEHTLMLRIWDTSGNSAVTTISFVVAEDVSPTLFDVYTDANPAVTSANFYLKHDRPDAVVTCSYEVFNMMGRLEWSTTITNRSDMFISSPVNWNLCNNAGQRLKRGIYLYRATVTCEGTTSSSKTKRIAISNQ